MTLWLNSSPLLFCYLLYDGESAAETLHEGFARANLKDLKVFLPPPPLTPPRTVSVALVCQHFTTTSRATRKWDRQALSLTTRLIPVDKLTLCDNIIMSPWQQSFLWWTLNELSYPRLFSLSLENQNNVQISDGNFTTREKFAVWKSDFLGVVLFLFLDVVYWFKRKLSLCWTRVGGHEQKKSRFEGRDWISGLRMEITCD